MARTGMSWEGARAQVGDLHRAGVRLVNGADAGINPGKPHGSLGGRLPPRRPAAWAGRPTARRPAAWAGRPTARRPPGRPTARRPAAWAGRPTARRPPRPAGAVDRGRPTPCTEGDRRRRSSVGSGRDRRRPPAPVMPKNATSSIARIAVRRTGPPGRRSRRTPCAGRASGRSAARRSPMWTVACRGEQGGLAVPTESSSGERRAQGGITETGNSPARRLLVEAAAPPQALPAQPRADPPPRRPITGGARASWPAGVRREAIGRRAGQWSVDEVGEGLPDDGVRPVGCAVGVHCG